MLPGWRRYAAAILITGSISSISGASAPIRECAAERPESAPSAIAGLEIGPDNKVDYREEVYHPALPRPETARGVLWVTADGRLVKDQQIPQREISEIGEAFVSVREAPEGPANLLPIPAEVRPMLDAIRLVIAGDAGAVADKFALDLAPGGPGWRVRLVARDPDAPEMQIALIGCGTVLRSIEIDQARGVRRIFTFEHQP
jgi:hypothetical protein